MVLLVPLLIFKKTLGLLKYFLIGRNSFAGIKVNCSTSMLSGGLSLMCLVIWGMIHHYQIVHFCLSGGSIAAQLPAFQFKGASHICFEGVWSNFCVRQSFVRGILIVLGLFQFMVQNWLLEANNPTRHVEGLTSFCLWEITLWLQFNQVGVNK